MTNVSHKYVKRFGGIFADSTAHRKWTLKQIHFGNVSLKIRSMTCFPTQKTHDQNFPDKSMMEILYLFLTTLYFCFLWS